MMKTQAFVLTNLTSHLLVISSVEPRRFFLNLLRFYTSIKIDITMVYMVVFFFIFLLKSLGQ